MKSRKESVILDLTNTLSLEIEGVYTPEEPQTWDYPGASSEFEIINIEIVKGTFNEFMDWNDGFLSSQITEMKHRFERLFPLHTQTLFEYLGEKCIEIIENE